MDAKVTWRVNPDPETLVAAILQCKDELLELARRKHRSTQVNVHLCRAYANGKPLAMLQLSDKHVPAVIMSAEELRVAPSKRNPGIPSIFGAFDQFDLFRLRIMDDETIRVELETDAGDNDDQTFYGNVSLVNA